VLTKRATRSVAGYAGGTKTGPNGRVCYHNPMAMDSDYGRMGHTEVVGVKVPEDKIPQFSDAFFALFINGDRADPQDRGGEYRGAFGIPGGDKHPQFAAFKEAAAKVNMKLIAGKGNDPDTSKKRAVFYYDTDNFPFFAGEAWTRTPCCPPRQHVIARAAPRLEHATLR